MKIKVTNILSSESSIQKYNQKDSDLINSIQLQRKFGLPEDYIEFHIYDLNDSLLNSNYNYTGYKSLLGSLPSPTNLYNSLNVDPSKDVSELGYNQGSVKILYNTFRNLFGGGPNNKFYIKDISTDRTELRITNNNIPNSNLESFYNNYLTSFISEAFYKDFYLNFGNDELIIGINAILEQDPNQYNILVKLYEPLPANIGIKDQFWVVDKLSDPSSYQIDFILESEDLQESIPYLRGPNFDLNVKNEVNPSIEYKNYNQLFSTTSTSSYQQLKSLLEEKSLEINVDYIDYENFVHFSSAKERLLNFIYKLKLIENYKADLVTLGTSTSTPQISSSKAILDDNISNILEKFDGYEYYLYYESGSKAWPKKNNTQPLINYEVTSSEAVTWLGTDDDNNLAYGGQLYTASNYDTQNQDNLYYTIPEYLRIDSENKGYEVFIYMIGQHFDNIWLYAKSVTDLWDSNNNLNKGISKDLVSYALKSLGIKLYSNTNVSSDAFSYLLGVTPSGSYQFSTGSEVITNLVTSSIETLAGSDIDKEIYKRLYHNLPYLLKTKGTERGLRALIACYGIPDTILRINEFGGTDKDSGSIEQYFNRVSYALSTQTGSVQVNTPWAPLVIQDIATSSANIVPDTIEFRFRTLGIPSASMHTQSLFQVGTGSDTQFGVQLLYSSESNPGFNRNYGDIRLIMSGSQGYVPSPPIHLPFFSGWWNLMVGRETGSIISSSITGSNKYFIYAANSIYNGHDGDKIGYIGSASIFVSGSSSSSYHQAWNNYNTSSFIAYLGGEDNNNTIAPSSSKFRGYLQELRYWAKPVSVYNFINHTFNPTSYESTDVTSSYNDLVFRLPLGSDLLISGSLNIYSVHPSFGKTGSFIFNSSTASYGKIGGPGISSSYGVAVYDTDVWLGYSDAQSIIYEADTTFYYLNAGNLGLAKPTNNKIRIINSDTLSGSTLSPFVKIEQNPELALTKDTNIVEVSISPQDQINTDIISQLGYFDIDDYIGDPRHSTSSQYIDLDNLREFYFKKYFKSYNYTDLIRIVKYYNNSLFKMIKDFTPARSNVSTGIVIKSHILERSKVKRFEPLVTRSLMEGNVSVGDFSGGSGGVLKSSYSYSLNDIIPTVSGGILNQNDYKWALYTGEISGSSLIVSTQSLQSSPYVGIRSINLGHYLHSGNNVLLNNISHSRKSTKYLDVDYSTDPNIAVNLDLIKSGSHLVYAPIQDSNYTLLRHTNPRYNGSKTISATYNDYTEGDTSYGKTAAIDKHTRKLGLFTNISNSLFLPNKSEVNLKYLVDEDGNLTELNTQNTNWFELQNTFKGGETLVVGQFDTLKYGNQKSLNGGKNIFNSGYSYTPILYFSGSGSEPTLVFEIFDEANKNFIVYNGDTLNVSTGSTTTASLFRSVTLTSGGLWNTSSSPIQQYYQAPSNGGYSFYSDLQLSGSNFVEVIQYDIYVPYPVRVTASLLTPSYAYTYVVTFTAPNNLSSGSDTLTGPSQTAKWDLLVSQGTNSINSKVRRTNPGTAEKPGYIDWYKNLSLVSSSNIVIGNDISNVLYTFTNVAEDDKLWIDIFESDV